MTIRIMPPLVFRNSSHQQGASVVELTLLIVLLAITAWVSIAYLGDNDSQQMVAASQALGGGTESSMLTGGTTHICPKDNPKCDEHSHN